MLEMSLALKSNAEQAKPWESMELRKQEEALAPPRMGALRKLLRRVRVPQAWELTASLRGYRWICRTSAVVEYSLLHKVEMEGIWSANASTTLFYLTPKHITLERPLALLPTLIRWREWRRAPAVVVWKGTHNFTWDGFF